MATTNTFYQLCLPIYCSKKSQIWEDVLNTMYLFPLYFVLVASELSTNIGVGCKIRPSWGPCDGLWVGKACGWLVMLCLCLSFTFWTFSFYHQLPCICHQSIFAVVPSQSCARRRSSMQRTAFDLETARKVHLHHFLSRHHNLFFSNSDLLPTHSTALGSSLHL